MSDFPDQDPVMGAYTSRQDEQRRAQVAAEGGTVEDDAAVDPDQVEIIGRAPITEDMAPRSAHRPSLDEDVAALLGSDQTDPDDEGTREEDPNGRTVLEATVLSGTIDPETGKVVMTDVGPGLDELPDEIVDALSDLLAIRKMREAPDGAEGELSGRQPRLDEAAAARMSELQARLGDLDEDEETELTALLAQSLGLGPDAHAESMDDWHFADRMGIGRAIEDGTGAARVAIILEVDPPEDGSGDTVRIVRTLTPLKAAEAASKLLEVALSMVDEGETGPDRFPTHGESLSGRPFPRAEAPAPDPAAEQLDTEE